MEDRQVLVDQSLDPTNHPDKEGRYRFTLGHEVGHWELHRKLCRRNRDQHMLFKDMRAPSIVCRTKSARKPAEWQANTFSACLLMPARMVIRSWERRHGSTYPYKADKEIAEMSKRWRLPEGEQPTVQVARDVAREFHVSGQAMQIRLIGLGLIRIKKTTELVW